MADIPFNASVPLIEQVKIQARVLIPVVKAIQVELGEERANEVVRNALDNVSRKSGETVNSVLNGNPVERITAAFPIAAAGHALDIEVIVKTSEAIECNVTGCRYAEFFEGLGESELGFMICCGGDWAMAEGVSPDLELTRTQTIMQGAPHCDFRYRLNKARSS